MRALLLPGCGSRGIVQAGMIQAYLEKYKTYDALYCSSAGSLNGALLHQGDFPKLQKLWQNMSNNQIFNWNPLKIFGPQASLGCTTPLRNLLTNHVNLPALLGNPKPIYVTTTQINPLQSVTRQLTADMDVVSWLLASASVPIVFPIQMIGGSQYCDGGVMRNFNIIQAVEDNKYDELIVLYPGGLTNKPIRNLIDAIDINFTAMGMTQYNDETSTVKLLDRMQHTVALTVYRPEASPDLGLLDFTKAGKNFQQYWDIGYNLLSKPTLQYRRVLEAGQSKWRIFR